MMNPANSLAKAMSGAGMVCAATFALPLMAQSQSPAARLEPPANAAAPYRDHVARIVADENWYEVERRGYKAQRARPNFEVSTVDDLTVYERRDLDRGGRLAQRKRGARLPTRSLAKTPQVFAAPNQYPGVARLQAGQTNRSLRLAPRMQTGQSQRVAGKAIGLASKASNLDLGAQMIGGRDIGVTRFASDLSVGQVSNAFSGGDPIASAAHSTKRFGRNLERGVEGIGQSIRDPRRIPGNAARALEGTGRAAVRAAQSVGETAIKTARGTTRMITQPGFAKKQVKKASKSVRNVGRSVCKGFSYLIPGASKKKCK